MKRQITIARMLRTSADMVENGTCGLDDEELLAMAEFLSRRKLNIEQICQRYGISRATLNRWQDKDKLPPFRKDSGGKDYIFSDEADEWVKKWEKTHEN